MDYSQEIDEADYNEESENGAEIQLEIPHEYAGFRLDAALAALLPDFSRARLSACIKDGAVTLNGNNAPPKTRLIGGESIKLTITPSEEVGAFAAEDIPLNIVYEDDAVLVLDKSAGLVVHPAAGNWSGTLLNALLFHRPALREVPRAGIVHRLDKDTSGLLVVAKTIAAQTHLVRQLQARSVKRIYRAIANGLIPYDGKIETLIGRNPHNRLKMAVLKFGGKEAITHITVLERFAAHTYVECALETGRTHQIRVHLREAGHPLAGDPLYGNPRHPCDDAIKDLVKNLHRQALHAHRLSFIHPSSGEEMSFQAALPEDMKTLLAALRGEFELHGAGAAYDDSADDCDDDDDDGVEVIYVRE
ncbi:MAG: 23S rRNA pseudouridine(1911/1915/1917) synthase RluD [Neisseria sp.]|nr:23S rRNA pseudouridine(1911/1915/1917) synthase RluD [Neisseria sp.]